MGETKIEWTDSVWNPSTGCAKVSQGCARCYAERLFPRVYGRDTVVVTQKGLAVPLSTEGTPSETRPRKFTDVRLHPERLEQPLHWKKPRRVFVNSMSDLFHEDIPDEFIDKVFAVMEKAPQHSFQILTKRAKRMLEYTTQLLPWIDGTSGKVRRALPNVWLGVSVENQATADERIPLLLQTPAAVRFVSAEPLLGPVDFTWIPLDDDVMLNCLNGFEDYHGPEIMGSGWGTKKLQWVIVGGESGPKARPMHPDWVRSIRDQCKEAKVPFFMKQWGEWSPEYSEQHIKDERFIHPSGIKCIDFEPGCVIMGKVGKKYSGSLLDGVEHKEYPEVPHA